jgi:hypothetical protein
MQKLPVTLRELPAGLPGGLLLAYALDRLMDERGFATVPFGTKGGLHARWKEELTTTTALQIGALDHHAASATGNTTLTAPSSVVFDLSHRNS